MPSRSTFWRTVTSPKRLRVSLKRVRRSDQIILALIAVLIGVTGGLAAIVFRYGIEFSQLLAFGYGGDSLASYVRELDWWYVVLVPTIGGLILGPIIVRVMPEGRPEAVQHVIEAAALKSGRMGFWTGIKAAVISFASIGCGASVGREGPVVHLGASLGSAIAQRLHLGRRLTRTLLGCGVAAAVAASFNAPIAGVFFALEVVVGHYALTAFAPIVLASVVATVISRMHYGDFPAFSLPHSYEIVSALEFPAFALLGVVCALAAGLFMWALMWAEDMFERSPLPRWARPAAGGLMIGLLALLLPEVLGVGYEATDAALREDYGLWLLLALVAGKTFATAVSLGSGFGGGVFSPSLFVGAMVGGAFGIIAGGVFPELHVGHGAYTIIGMAAVSGAVLGAPVSTILIVFEMTGDYALTIALMLATAIASLLVHQVLTRSFFYWQLERRGLDVSRGREVSLLREVKVRGLIDRDYAAVALDTPIEEVRKALVRAPYSELLVVDGDGRLRGVITFSELSSVAFDTSHDRELTAVSVARGTPPMLLADDDLSRAIDVFRGTGEPHIPVVDNDEARRLLGLAHEHEVMAAYHRTLLQIRAEESGEAAGS